MKVHSQMALSKKIAFSAIIAALSVVLLYIGSISVLDMSSVVICALLTMLVVVEAGEKFAWLAVLVTGVLSLLLLPVKLPALLYLFFGGIYPILKAWLEKTPYWLSWLFKISVLDTMLLASIALSKLVFTAEEPFFDFTGLVLLVGTIFFILYDLALTTCVTAYITRLRKRLGLKKLF
ncbi:MAG: hypothetical protein E7631_05570 [Ruminococcaceae bacterium]|nr:hypothetical protein [Oscillospiraceae bacterium]